MPLPRNAFLTRVGDLWTAPEGDSQNSASISYSLKSMNLFKTKIPTYTTTYFLTWFKKNCCEQTLLIVPFTYLRGDISLYRVCDNINEINNILYYYVFTNLSLTVAFGGHRLCLRVLALQTANCRLQHPGCIILRVITAHSIA